MVHQFTMPECREGGLARKAYLQGSPARLSRTALPHGSPARLSPTALPHGLSPTALPVPHGSPPRLSPTALPHAALPHGSPPRLTPTARPQHTRPPHQSAFSAPEAARNTARRSAAAGHGHVHNAECEPWPVCADAGSSRGKKLITKFHKPATRSQRSVTILALKIDTTTGPD